MLYGLIGEHLGHSYSKEIHSKIADYDYTLCEVSRDGLEDFIKLRDFRGINVTIPYKQSVIPLLDEISDEAAAIGAVNTVVNKNGRLCGYNTDFYGMKALIERAGVSLDGKTVLILGSGGTSNTALAVAKSLGAGRAFRVSRSGKDGAITYDAAYALGDRVQIIINTTPSGMFPEVCGTPVDVSRFSRLEGVFDAVYNPVRTNLVLDAVKRGIPACGGLYMLVTQAVYAYALFTDTPVRAQLIEKIYKEICLEKQNIVLVGMPSSGKSTVGKLIAEKCGKPFFDTDSEFVKSAGMPIPAYFEKYGEAAFRKAESEIIKQVSLKSGCVIATGGGAVLNPENVRSLRRNGTVVFLKRPLESLIVSKERPLSSSREAVANMYAVRLPLYEGAADFTADNSGTPEDAATLILKEMSK